MEATLCGADFATRVVCLLTSVGIRAFTELAPAEGRRGRRIADGRTAGEAQTGRGQFGEQTEGSKNRSETMPTTARVPGSAEAVSRPAGKTYADLKCQGPEGRSPIQTSLLVKGPTPNSAPTSPQHSAAEDGGSRPPSPAFPVHLEAPESIWGTERLGGARRSFQ
jgi:hypothetical protein